MAATFAPEGHIRKRQFQPSINCYFSQRNANSSSAPERARSPMSPPLPDETQASLLSVGMRVRKSVPEGYKTHKTTGLPEVPVPSTAPVRKMRTATSGMSTKELMPFCGLHKTGGWSAQQAPASSAPAGLSGTSAGGDDMPGMTMSQDTLPSTHLSFGINDQAYATNNRKRTYEEEVEEDLDAYFNVLDSEPVHIQRPVARMKQPARKLEQDAARRQHGDDFDDAVFLAPLDGMDVDDF